MKGQTTRRSVAGSRSRIHVGVGGWSYAPWRGTFYPADLIQREELQFASRQLTSIEINSTFYGSQRAASFSKWHDATPEGFVFAVKGPRAATNRRVLAETGEAIERFLGSGVLNLKDKLGPINWQLPPGKRFDAADMDAFLRLLPAKVGRRALRHAIEVRHPSFDTPEFIALASEHRVAITLAGDSKYPHIGQPDPPFIYARIMGTQAKWKSGYAPRALDAWAKQAREWAQGGKDVYLYVISGCKERNPAAAMALIGRLDDGGGNLPATRARARRKTGGE